MCMCVYTKRTIFLPLRKVFVYRDDIGNEVACKLKLYIYIIFFLSYSLVCCASMHRELATSSSSSYTHNINNIYTCTRLLYYTQQCVRFSPLQHFCQLCRITYRVIHKR